MQVIFAITLMVGSSTLGMRFSTVGLQHWSNVNRKLSRTDTSPYVLVQLSVLVLSLHKLVLDCAVLIDRV